MEIVKNILLVIYVIVTLALIIITLVQSKESSGVTSTITGSSTTKEGRMKRWTISLGVAFAVLAVALSIFYI